MHNKEGEDPETAAQLTLFNNNSKASPRMAGALTSWTPSVLSLLSESVVAHSIVSHDMELALSRHFSSRYFYLLILPNCHSGFHDAWLAEIQELMVTHKSLYYSVIACAASHAHFADASPRMQDLALNYYTNALGELCGLLAKGSRLESHNAVLMTVMLLYLHGCFGSSSYSEIPQHLGAAARIIAFRLLTEGAVVRCLFDRLAVESVLYQIFLVTTGLWSKDGGFPYQFDPGFWDRAEKLLERSNFFPASSTSFNSPVLGVPVPLFRLTLSLSQLCLGRTVLQPADLENLRSEVETWELALFAWGEAESSDMDEHTDGGQEAYYRDTSRLFATIASVMLEHITRCGSRAGLPRVNSSSSWQVRMALGLLSRRHGDDGWFASYLGNWPVYALGFFLDEPEERKVVRRELERRWDLTRFTQIMRFLGDLEKAWAERDAGGSHYRG